MAICKFGMISKGSIVYKRQVILSNDFRSQTQVSELFKSQWEVVSFVTYLFEDFDWSVSLCDTWWTCPMKLQSPPAARISTDPWPCFPPFRGCQMTSGSSFPRVFLFRKLRSFRLRLFHSQSDSVVSKRTHRHFF